MPGSPVQELFERQKSYLIARKSQVVSKMIPGNWGKVESGWLARPLLERIARFGGGGRIHQFLWSRSHAVSSAKRNLAARSDEKPLQVGSSSPGWFRAWGNRSYPEGKWLLLCISTERVTLADSINRLKPPNESHRKVDKRSRRTGKITQARQAA
jgi:hypothetical protein